MSDLIDRQAAIDAVHKNYDVILDFTSDGQTISFSIEDILSELPSAQPGWIPVTERLPEYGTTVLTCNHDGEYEINHIIDEEDGEWFWDGAVAWMPLPKLWENE